MTSLRVEAEDNWDAPDHAAASSYTQQRPGATSAHTFYLRTDRAGYDIDRDDRSFWIVAARGAVARLLLGAAAAPSR